MFAAGDNLQEKSAFVWRKNTAKERATMQNERRRRKRKARSAKKEENREKRVLTLENEQLRTTANLMAKNERLLYLARKYYAKWKTLHCLEQVGKSVNVYVILSNVFKV